MVPPEQLAHLLGQDRHVHRADQRQPLIRARTKGSHFALRIHHRLVRRRKKRARCPQARRHHPGPHISRSDRPHHVVAAARRNHHPVGQSPPRRQFAAQHPVALEARSHRRQHLRHPGVDRRHQVRMPLPRPHVQQTGARGIAVFHPLHPGQEKIQVVVRQQHRRGSGKIFRLVTLQPQDLRRREPRRDRIARRRNQAARPPKGRRQFIALLRRRGVAPQLRRPHHRVVRIQRHQPMLLTAHPDRPNLLPTVPQRRHTRPHRRLHRPHPVRRMLLQMPGRQAVDQAVPLRPFPCPIPSSTPMPAAEVSATCRTGT